MGRARGGRNKTHAPDDGVTVQYLAPFRQSSIGQPICYPSPNSALQLLIQLIDLIQHYGLVPTTRYPS